MLSLKEKLASVPSLIDHTALKPTTDIVDIDRLCDEAIKYQFASVCIPQKYVQLANSLLAYSRVEVCTVVGFPLGSVPTHNKIFETENAIEDGATEIDMVVDIDEVLSGRYDRVEKDIRAVVDAAGGNIVKVILETCYLGDDHIVNACKATVAAGAHFVKTSTGFGSAGATPYHVELMAKAVAGQCLVKASGGIKTWSDALDMIRAGADRLGVSSGVQIASEWCESEFYGG